MPTCFWILVVSSPTCLWWKRGPVGLFFWARVTKKWGTAKVARFTVPKKFPGSSKDCKIQSLLCDKASGNSKGSQIHCAKKIFWEQQRLQDSIFTVSGNSKGSKIHCVKKKFSGSSKDCKIQPLLCDKASGNSKGTKIYCAKKFSGSSKDCQIQSLLCDKASGNSKGAKICCAKKFLGAAKIARFSLYCATKLLGTAKVARFTVPKIFWEPQRLQDSVFTVRQSFWEQQRQQDSLRQKIFWAIGKLTCQNLCQYTVNTNLRPNGHTRAYSPENKTCKHTQT